MNHQRLGNEHICYWGQAVYGGQEINMQYTPQYSTVFY